MGTSKEKHSELKVKNMLAFLHSVYRGDYISEFVLKVLIFTRSSETE